LEARLPPDGREAHRAYPGAFRAV